MHRTSATAFMARTAVIALLACVATIDAHPVWAEDGVEERDDSRSADEDVDRVRSTRTRYTREEREFGEIAPDFRGPVELAFYSGWTLYDDELELETGGSMHAGLRLSMNFGEDNQFAFDLGGMVTRIRYKVRRVIQNRFVQTRGEVTLSTGMIGLTYRPSFLRFEFASPYVRIGVGYVQFYSTDHRGQVSGPSGGLLDVHFGNAIGFATEIALGVDYKVSRNMSLKLETNLQGWLINWLDRDDEVVNGSLIEVGLVWHFG